MCTARHIWYPVHAQGYINTNTEASRLAKTKVKLSPSRSLMAPEMSGTLCMPPWHNMLERFVDFLWGWEGGFAHVLHMSIQNLIDVQFLKASDSRSMHRGKLKHSPFPEHLI